jgi:hypothetical protein
VNISPSVPSTGTIHNNGTWASPTILEINHKIDMKVKKDYQVIISPLLQSMLGFRQAIFPGGDYVSDWVADPA